MDSHHGQLQKIAQSAADRAPVSGPYDSVSGQVAEEMNNLLAEIQVGCGLTHSCRFSPKWGGWWFDYQLQWLGPCNLRSGILCDLAMLCLLA